MGFIAVMKQQKNPDGREGHKEREEIQRRSKLNKRKKKYIGAKEPKRYPPMLPWQKKEVNNRLNKVFMKSNCASYKEGCTIENCTECKRNPEVKK